MGLLEPHRDPRLAKLALDCLHDMGPRAKDAVPFAKKHVRSPVGNVRWAALSVLCAAAGDDAEAVDTLLAALSDASPTIRGNVARILGANRVAPDRAIPAVARLLDDPDQGARSWAIYALGDYGEPALPHLVKAFGDPHEGNRTVVVFKLGQMGIEALPTLLRALRSRSAKVRTTAGNALKRFGPLAVVCYLEAWRDPDPDVRTFAARKLKEMGEVATPALLRMLREKDRR
jgi:HEAT repeat protein